MTDDELMALIKSVDPQAVRIPPGIRSIADRIEQAGRQAALEDDARDAARYRWLRQQQWNEADMFVVTGSKSRVYLGTFCPSLALLDEAIDAAMTAAQPATGDAQ